MQQCWLVGKMRGIKTGKCHYEEQRQRSCRSLAEAVRGHFSCVVLNNKKRLGLFDPYQYFEPKKIFFTVFGKPSVQFNSRPKTVHFLSALEYNGWWGMIFKRRTAAPTAVEMHKPIRRVLGVCESTSQWENGARLPK